MKVLTLSCLALSAFASLARADNSISVLFDEGRRVAMSQVQSILPCSLKGVATVDQERWILANQQTLAQDLAASTYVWQSDSKDTCAVTQFFRNAPINLYQGACQKEATSPQQAAAVLIRESIFHHGQIEEAQAKAIAQAIQHADLSCSPGGSTPAPVPVPQGGDVFDPSYCSGAPMTAEQALTYLPLPSAFERKLGAFKYAGRARACYTVGGCRGWSNDDAVLTMAFRDNHNYDRSSNVGAQVGTGDIFVHLASDKPMLELRGVNTTSYKVSLGAAISGAPYPALTMQGTFNESSYHGAGALMARGVVGAASFQGKLTNSCAWFVTRASYPGSSSEGNSFRIDEEAVFYGSF